MSKQSELLTIRLEPELKDRLKAFAKATGVPMSLLVVAQIKTMLKTGQVNLAITESKLDKEISKILGDYDDRF